MKKVFMIGTFDELNKDLESAISDYYGGQKCIGNASLVGNMLNMQHPDLAIISLIGMDENGDKIFNDIRRNFEDMPVVVIGNVNEQYEFSRYLGVDQFHRLTRPVSNEEILDTVISKLDKNGSITRNKGNDSGERKKLLLVDDNPVQLRMLNDALKGKYDVQMATSGMKAISMLEKSVPDLIFLDYEMPMCDGKMTLEMIRGLDDVKDIPVVFLTGIADKEHIQAVLDLKPAGYLLKTTSTDRIFETLERIFEEN